MSQPSKRTAEAAFEDLDNTNKRTHKRSRKHRQSRNKTDTPAEEETVTSIPTKKRKRDHKGKRPLGAADPASASGSAAVDQNINQNVNLSKERERKNNQNNQRNHGGQSNSKSKPAQENGWTLTQGIGGSFIAHDPLLVADDRFLILPMDFSVRVYSASTSLLVRSLHVEESARIASCAISRSDSSRLLVATSGGLIILWDWTQGQKVYEWKIHKGIKQIIPVTSTTGTEQVLILRQRKDEGCTLSSFALMTSARKATEGKLLLQRNGINPTVQFFENTGLILASAYSKLILGYAPKLDNSNLKDASFTWREVSVGGPITTLDARVNTKVKRAPAAIDIVIGLETGAILLYEDLMFKLIGKERGNQSSDIVARRLHWHRNTVNTVKWSRDGNYLISGGNETVLVIWQLDTNQKQFLPHLSSPILNLVVSDGGSRYGVRLGDNSVMVLSTADLLPSANISGLAVAQDRKSHIPAALHPSHLDRLLMAVPSNVSSTTDSECCNATVLQTYDVVADLQIGRQALARNMTTALNIGPEGQAVEEPEVTHLQISQDGKWLATIDQWHPPSRDLNGLYLVDEETARDRRMETTLKFWTYNEEQHNWELVTRVDEPHSQGSTVLDLKAHPTKVEFATVGSDGTMRTWTPKSRARDGVLIKNQSGAQLYTWTCAQTVHCNDAAEDVSSGEASATLAYAEDGSVVATSWSPSHVDSRYTSFIDPRRGSISLSVPDLVTSGNICLAFSGRYLLCLSQSFCVFDTVGGEIVFSIDLAPEFRSSQSGRFLAINRLDGTFALGLNSDRKNAPGRLSIFDMIKTASGPVCQEMVPGQIKAMLSSPLTPGYLIIDGHSRIRQTRGSVSPSNGLVATVRPEPDVVTKGLDNIFGTGSLRAGTKTVPLKLPTSAEHEATTTSQSLDSVLNLTRSSDAPPVGELFDRIARIYALPAVGA